jgi:antitoxin VapB
MKKSKHLDLKGHETHRLASELAEPTGESLTSMVILGLRERLARKRRRPDRIAAHLMKIGSLLPRWPTPDALSMTSSDTTSADDQGDR